MKEECNCSEIYNCCDCGGNECGCAYCWSCNACEHCLNEDDDSIQPQIGQKAVTREGMHGEIVSVQNNIVEIKLTSGQIIKRYPTQIEYK